MTRMIPPFNVSTDGAAGDNSPNDSALRGSELIDIAQELSRLDESKLSAQEVACLRANDWRQDEDVRQLFIASINLEEEKLGVVEDKKEVEELSLLQRRRVWGQISRRIAARDQWQSSESEIRASRIWQLSSIIAVAASIICIWAISGRVNLRFQLDSAPLFRGESKQNIGDEVAQKSLGGDGGVSEIGRIAHRMLERSFSDGENKAEAARSNRWTNKAEQMILKEGLH